MTNCPNCGAPISGAECAYCGTKFYNFVNLDPREKVYLSISHAGKVYTLPCYIGSINVEINSVGSFVGRDITGRLMRTAARDVQAVQIKFIGM